MRDYLDSPPLKLRGDHPLLSAQRRPFFLTVLFCVIAFVVIFLDHRGTLEPVRDGLSYVITPVARALSTTRDSVVGFWAGIEDVRTLRQENQQLQRQVSLLQEELIAREQDAIENTHLRQQLAIEQERPWKLIGADVVIRSPDAGRRMITLSRGRNHGIQPGMAVIGQTGSQPSALVGVVEKVGPDFATVLLITDVSSSISARVLHQNDSALGLVHGQWQQGARLRLEKLDKVIPLTPETIVVSAGLTGQLELPLPMASVPPDIPIGRVENVIADDPHTHIAELRPFVDPDQVHYVWVILSHAE